MVLTAGNLLGGDAGEVCDVFGKQDIAAFHRGSENLGGGPAGETFLVDGGGGDSCGAQSIRQAGRVHLVEEDLQDLDAASVSCRCSSMRASISSG